MFDFFTPLAPRFNSTEVSTPQHAVLIGAGPSNLFSAIKLLEKGYNVTILERRSQIGGLCSDIVIGGQHFELANQIGTSVFGLLKKSGINFEVQKVKNEFIFPDGNRLYVPIAPMTIWNLLYPRSIWQITKLIHHHEYNKRLSEIMHKLNPQFGQMILGMFGYQIANPSINVAQLIKAIKDTGGYSKPLIPIKGMPTMIKAMSDKILSLNGIIKTNQECLEVFRLKNNRQLVTTQDNQYEADLVLNSNAWRYYPVEAKPGLPLTSIFIQMDQKWRYTKEIKEELHTLTFFPEKIDFWFEQLDKSYLNDSFLKGFGFHCFKNRLSDNTFTIFILTPRYIENFNESEKQNIIDYVLSSIQTRLPGFKENITKLHFFSPFEFKQHLGLSPRIPQLIAPPGFIPPTYDPVSGVHFVGSATYPESPNIFGSLISAYKKIAEISKQDTINSNRYQISI
jgi:phytoene dehydrogenase-like protein